MPDISFITYNHAPEVNTAKNSSSSDDVKETFKKLYSAEKHAVEVLEKEEKTTKTPMTTKKSSADKAGGNDKEKKVSANQTPHGS